MPELYGALAPWFELLTWPEQYEDEAAEYSSTLRRALDSPGRRAWPSLLELGAGAGNNAFWLKRGFACTLTDLSPDMLRASRERNPECEHLAGDMRTLRLGRTFDCVFVHDAVMYLRSEADLRAAIATAFAHLRPGGAALFAPDWTRESFVPGADHGGRDAEDGSRGLRFLEWQHDPDPSDETYVADFALLLREGSAPPRVVHDRHVLGLFPRATWLRLLAAEGFVLRDDARPAGPRGDDLFVAVRP